MGTWQRLAACGYQERLYEGWVGGGKRSKRFDALLLRLI
jgi:hypothetical protein